MGKIDEVSQKLGKLESVTDTILEEIKLVRKADENFAEEQLKTHKSLRAMQYDHDTTVSRIEDIETHARVTRKHVEELTKQVNSIKENKRRWVWFWGVIGSVVGFMAAAIKFGKDVLNWP